ncbi:MAG TPA: ParB N-terminal domain-containing protein [Pirellulales bacterium]|nr:ParB N-terminal domain-containing protein [Pirellulales bacterium]
MKIVMRKLSQITPYDRNPRLNDAAVADVEVSIRQFGFRQPIVVDGQGEIIVGDTRYKAAQRIGLEKVPVLVAGDLTPEQVRAYRIADNKTGELAGWDFDRLAAELTALNEADFDTSLLGFADEELAKLIEPPSVPDVAASIAARGKSPRANSPPRDTDAPPQPPSELSTRPGDLWLLGEHRLLCGAAQRPEDLEGIFDGPPVQLVEPDPRKCDIIVGHWERRAGRKAQRATGAVGGGQ